MVDKKAEQDRDDAESEFVEMDPTGRYGRYKEVLGKGAFKTVYRAFDELEGMEVAWNQVKVHDVLRTSEDLERLYSEVHLLKTLDHKNIIKFYSSWVDKENGNINFITEIFMSGTLRQYRKKHKHVDMRALKNWSHQILEGLLYLHSHDPPIIHRDLKCDNIFINGNQGEVKIGDLGLAAILRQAHAAHSVIGTPEFMAPELYEEEYNELVDIYSFGMCLLEMVTFEYPYSECANAAQIYKKVTSGIKPAALDKVKNPEVRAFIEKCLVNASRRLSARELLMDPFLQCEDGKSTDHVPCLTPLHYVGHGNGSVFKEPSHFRDKEDVLKLTEKRNSKSVKDLNLLEHQNSTVGALINSELASWDNFQQSENYLEGEDISSNVNDDGARANRDFTVKGQRKDHNTIFLRLRIADQEGHVRNIHFPFDIEDDTAMSVASEMVTELDLSDQDVTNIANRIDAEIKALVPEWKSGVSFEDAVDEEMCTGYHSCAIKDDAPDIPSDAVGPCQEFVLERLPSGRKYWSDSPRPSPGDSFMKIALINASPRMEGLTNSRFEEVNCDQSVSGSDEHCFDRTSHSSQSDNHEDSGANLDTKYSKSVGRMKVLENGLVINKGEANTFTKVVKMPTGILEINDKIEEVCEDKNQESQHIKGCGISNSLDQHVSAGRDHDKTVSAESESSCDAGILAELEVGDEHNIAQKFEYLVLKQQEELEGLRQKHQRAIQEFLNQLPQKGYGMHLLNNGLTNDIYNISINASAIKDQLSNDASSMICRKEGDKVFNQKQSTKNSENPTSMIEKDVKHEATCKDAETVTANKDLTFGLSTHYEQNVKHAGYPVDEIAREKETKKLSSKGMGSREFSSLSGSMQNMETDFSEADKLEAEKCVKQVSTGSQLKMSNNVLEGSGLICTDGSQRVDKAAKRNSYIEFYKGRSSLREKSNSSKGEVKIMDITGSSSSSFNSKSYDNVHDKRKKEQLHKSIADFEAKTLEGLKQSKGGYLSSKSTKQHGGTVSQAGTVGSNALGTRQPVTPETTRA